MPRPAGASRSCPTARRPPWSPGCGHILVSRSCAGTARPPMPRPSTEPCPTRCRSALEEIRELGYTGSANLLVRYLNQGRAEGDRPVTTPRHASRLRLTDPENLRPMETTLLE